MNKQDSQNKAVKFWLAYAKDNFIAAKAMFKAGRWSLCMFMCQQTLEALLKAIVIIQIKKQPPYIHELGLILRASGLKAPSGIINSLRELDKHYIKTRYKEDRFNSKVYNKESAFYIMQQTRKTIKWFTKKANLNL